MRRGAAPPPPPPVEFTPWKPERCEEPGCTARWPSYSRNGMAGPWRCREHDQLHANDTPPPPPAAPSPPKPPQGRLL